MVKGASNRGKTAAIRRLAGRLAQIGVPIDAPLDEAEVEAIVPYGKKLLGIRSQGDPGCGSVEWVREAVAAGCEVIVVASRSGGETEGPIRLDIATSNGYEVVQVAPFRVIGDDSPQLYPVLADILAGTLLDLINTFINR